MGEINSGGYYLMTPHTKEIIFASDHLHVLQIQNYLCTVRCFISQKKTNWTLLPSFEHSPPSA